MSLKARSKMISFRLSAEEYDQFRELCYAQGIHSVSELARAAVNRLVKDPNRASVRSEALETRVTSLEDQIQLLTLELRRLKNGTSAHPKALSASQEVS